MTSPTLLALTTLDEDIGTYQQVQETVVTKRDVLIDALSTDIQAMLPQTGDEASVVDIKLRRAKLYLEALGAQEKSALTRARLKLTKRQEDAAANQAEIVTELLNRMSAGGVKIHIEPNVATMGELEAAAETIAAGHRDGVKDTELHADPYQAFPA